MKPLMQLGKQLKPQRTIWSYGPSAKRVGRRVMSYAERRVVGYSAEQMFDVVNNVADYPKFVPYCKQVLTHKHAPRCAEYELFVGFPLLSEHYTSRVTSLRPSVVHSVCTEGRIFNLLDTTWKFGPSPAAVPNSCTLHYSLEFEFKWELHAALSHIFFGRVVKMMVSAFLTRASQQHGPPAIDASQPVILSYRN